MPLQSAVCDNLFVSVCDRHQSHPSTAGIADEYDIAWSISWGPAESVLLLSLPGCQPILHRPQSLLLGGVCLSSQCTAHQTHVQDQGLI